MAGGQAIEGAKRGVLFQVDPFQVQLAGIDFEVGADDPMYANALRNKEPVDPALIDSVMRNGIILAIATTKRGEAVVALDGNQRVRAAREATLKLQAVNPKESIVVPCQTPRRGENDAKTSEVMIAANEIRRDNGTLVKAELAVLHLNRWGGNFKEAAKAFGISENQYRLLLKLNEAAPAVKKAVETGRIGTSAAMEIAGLPKEEQAERLEETIAAGGTVDVAKNVKRKAQGTTKTSRPSTSLLKALWKKRKDEAVTGDLDDGFIECLGWILGEMEAGEISGLTEAIDAVESEE